MHEHGFQRGALGQAFTSPARLGDYVWLRYSTDARPCRKPYPAWQSIENRTMIVRNEGSLQAHWLDGCRSDPVAGNA